jgi:sirohydrochlorin ferrochelatase
MVSAGNKFGVLVISHGSRSSEWVRLVDEAVSQVKVPSDIPVESSFLEIVEGRLIQDGINRLEASGVTDIIAVPLFVSSGSTHIDEISYALGVILTPKLETDLEPFRMDARVHWCPPIDDDPEIAEILYEKIKSLSVDAEREFVVIVGHGSKEPGFHEVWQRVLDSLAMQVKELGGFAGAGTAMLLPDQLREKMKEWTDPGTSSMTVLIAPFFLSEGYFTEQVIPSRLEGFTYRYAGEALLPHPFLARWMEGRIRAVTGE